MQKGVSIRLSGAGVPETAAALRGRLIELGRCVECVDAQMAARLGGGKAAGYTCNLLTRNGVIVIVAAPGVDVEGESIECEVAVHDTPDFAAEKILDALAEQGFIAIETGAYSAEEEEQIRQRLADLGYIE
ncbi:MAG TPA: hypothetical protein HPP77_04405 [Candidatus Hydrogenedentes bacterium]|nr:hypothetical protein [Candidatus Hydrogenedentota bacterium]